MGEPPAILKPEDLVENYLLARQLVERGTSNAGLSHVGHFVTPSESLAKLCVLYTFSSIKSIFVYLNKKYIKSFGQDLFPEYF